MVRRQRGAVAARAASPRLRWTAAVSFLLSAACSSGDNPAGPQPSPSASAPPVTVAPSPTPTPAAFFAVEQGCTRGRGKVDASCGSSASLLVGDLERAIDTLILTRPLLFNLNEYRCTGCYRVVDYDRFIAALIEELGRSGVCGAVDMWGDSFLLKRDDTYSEQFQLTTGQGFLRRGGSAYVKSCLPAAFPLTPKDVTVKMFVGLYNYKCDVTQPAPPHPDSKKLPIYCEGLVTATPKDVALRSLPPRVHGPDVEWFVLAGEGKTVNLFDYDQPFNKVIQPLNPGRFSVCATVLEVTSCLHGEVVLQ